MIFGMRLKNRRAEDAAAMLKSLGHPQRLMMMCLLSHGERSVGDIQQSMGMGQAQVSQQLAKLREQGLVVGDKRGQWVMYRLANKKVEALMKAMADIYCPELFELR